MVKREEAIWLVIRAVGLNVLAFTVVAATSVAEYAVRIGSQSRAASESALHLWYWYLGWSIVRFATHAALAAYLLLGGSFIYRLIDRVVPAAER